MNAYAQYFSRIICFETNVQNANGKQDDLLLKVMYLSTVDIRCSEKSGIKSLLISDITSQMPTQALK